MFKSFLPENPIKKFLYRISIRSRILLYFVFLIFLPTSIISATVYNKSKNIITKRVVTSIENNLNMAETTLNQKMEDINDIMTLIYFAPELQSILSSPNAYNKPALINEVSALDRILNYYNIANPSKTALYPKLYVFNRPEYHFYGFSDNVADLGQIESKDWYKKLPYQSRYSIVGLSSITTASGKFNTIKIAKRLYGLQGQQLPYGALLTMDAAVDDFNGIVSRFSPSSGSRVLVMDGQNTVIITSDPVLLGKNLSGEAFIRNINNSAKPLNGIHTFTSAVYGIDTLVAVKGLPQLNWSIVSLSPVSEMYGELISFNKVVVIVILATLVLVLVMAIFLSENVSYPIRKLSKSMSVVKDGNFEINLEYKRNDEFAHLIRTYKNMVGEIKELIDKLYVSELNKKEAELVSLQAQINPHFLYNTLDSVNWLAIKHKAPDISTMVTYLSDFFRYSLSKGRSIIPIGDEIKQVDSYLAIQKIRFRDKLDYRIEVPKDILNCLTIKLMLQPIVENAIVHGIGALKENGSISISACRIGDDLEFSISDNGVGADLDTLHALLLEKAPSGKAYGMKNVNERVKQTFGPEYGIHFTANSPKGITVVIRIKAIKTMEGFHVNNDHRR